MLKSKVTQNSSGDNLNSGADPIKLQQAKTLLLIPLLQIQQDNALKRHDAKIMRSDEVVSKDANVDLAKNKINADDQLIIPVVMISPACSLSGNVCDASVSVDSVGDELTVVLDNDFSYSDVEIDENIDFAPSSVESLSDNLHYFNGSQSHNLFRW